MMGSWFIIGVILICITLFLLKHTQVYLGYNYTIKNAQWSNVELQLWGFLLIIIIGMIPIINIVMFSILFFTILSDSDYRCTFILKHTNNKVIVYIKKILTKKLF